MTGFKHGFNRGASLSVRPVSQCPDCGKLCYASRAEAKRAARAMSGTGVTKMRPYACGQFWHLTSWPASAVAGSRRDRLP